MLGGAVEFASKQPALLGLLDWSVGAALLLVALAGPRRRSDAFIACSAGALWFASTAALTPVGWWHGLDAPLALAYRGPLLHLLLTTRAAGRVRGALLAVGYGAALIVAPWAGLATALMALLFAAVSIRRSRPAAAALLGLAGSWLAAALGWLSSTPQCC